jgi:quinol monooxygenase YgiN
MTVIVVGYLRFPAESIPTVRPHLQRLVEETRRLDGCIRYDVAQDLFDPGLIRFSEGWPDEASLVAHLRAPHIAPWREAARSLGLLERRFMAYDGENPRPV